MRFLDAEFVQGFIRMADDGWLQGWHERNGGNLSYRVKPEEVEMVKEKSVYCKSKELSSPDLAAWFARSLLFSEEGDELRCPTKEIMLVSYQMVLHYNGNMLHNR